MWNKISAFEIKKCIRNCGKSLKTEGKFYQSWWETLISFPSNHTFCPAIQVGDKNLGVIDCISLKTIWG